MSDLRRLIPLAALLLLCPAANATLSFSPANHNFGGQSMMTTSSPVSVTVRNTGVASLTVNNVRRLGSSDHVLSHDCGLLASNATCRVNVRFTPTSEGWIYGQFAFETTAGEYQLFAHGQGERSLATHYYRSILRREPDAGGKAYWEGEALRLAALGASRKEAWLVMASSFFASPEYRAFNRNDTEYLRDLYLTFFNRDADAGGLAHWGTQLRDGMTRDALLASFIFSPEFTSFSEAIFGQDAVRGELATATDFYRGLLGRPADTGGFNYWVKQFRIAQCQGADDVGGEADAISRMFIGSPEYLARGRSNREFVSDMYNAFMRRGADLEGLLYWVRELQSGARSRDDVRLFFVASPEFSARVLKVVGEGCMHGVCSPFGADWPSNPTQRVRIAGGGSTEQFRVTIPEKCGWSVTGAPSWIQLDRTAGVGPQTINVTVPANNSTSLRQDYVRFAAPGATGSFIQVTQSAGIAAPPPPLPPPDSCLLAGYCRSNGVCCARGYLGCGNQCYSTTGAAYRGGGCTSFYTFCPN